MAKQQFRVTWRQELYIEANSKEEAREIWENTNLGELNKEVENKNIQSHDFVELVDIEEEE